MLQGTHPIVLRRFRRSLDSVVNSDSDYAYEAHLVDWHDENSALFYRLGQIMAHTRRGEELLRDPKLRLDPAQARPQRARWTTPAVRGTGLAPCSDLNSYDASMEGTVGRSSESMRLA